MFELTMKTDNAAFGDPECDRPIEVARILKAVAEALHDGRTEGFCTDINGNNVGSWNLGPPE